MTEDFISDQSSDPETPQLPQARTVDCRLPYPNIASAQIWKFSTPSGRLSFKKLNDTQKKPSLNSKPSGSNDKLIYAIANIPSNEPLLVE